MSSLASKVMSGTSLLRRFIDVRRLVAAGLVVGTSVAGVVASGSKPHGTAPAANVKVRQVAVAPAKPASRAAVAPAATSSLTSSTALSPAALALQSRVGYALRGSTARYVNAYVDVQGLGAVYNHYGTAAAPPASTEKTLTGLTALERLGAGRRFVTTLGTTVAPDAHGVVRGSMVLVAGGDPTLSDTGVRQLVAGLRARNVRYISAGYVIDARRYDGVVRAPGWKPGFVPEETGPLSAFMLNGNQYRGDSAYLANPVPGNAMRVLAAVRAAGIVVHGITSVRAAPPVAVAVRLYSPTVGQIVTGMMKNSINMRAEIMAKELGASAARGTVGTTAGGAAAIQALAKQYGVTLGTIADGSGLSSYDRETPAHEVAWLTAARRTASWQVFLHSLPVGCVDGTLKHRFCGTAAAGRVSAKTGTLDNVRVLAGYTRTRSGRLVTFSFMLSGVTYGPSATLAIDRAVVALASYTG